MDAAKGFGIAFEVDAAIRFAHVKEDYKVRLEPEKILPAVKARRKADSRWMAG